MRVLIVARCKNGRYAPFITEQVESIEEHGLNCQYFGVDGKGIVGYLRQIPKLKKAIRDFHPDIIHAHYGLCGLLANYQRKVPVVTTYHGSDINNPRVLRLSKWCIHRSRFNIFVSQRTINIADPKKDFELIPCGINLNDYQPIDKAKAREIMCLKSSGLYVLFSGAFDNRVKNAPLAKAAMSNLSEVELLELKGYTRNQVAILMQAVDALLMTSFTEGSPQVIKEAMACGCPIVSVDVGDVKEVTKGVAGCFISESNPESIAKNLRDALNFKGDTGGRKAIIEKGLTNENVSSRLIDVYNSLLN